MLVAAINMNVVLRTVRCMGSPSTPHVSESAFPHSPSRDLPRGTSVSPTRSCMRLKGTRQQGLPTKKGARSPG